MKIWFHHFKETNCVIIFLPFNIGFFTINIIERVRYGNIHYQINLPCSRFNIVVQPDSRIYLRATCIQPHYFPCNVTFFVDFKHSFFETGNQVYCRPFRDRITDMRLSGIVTAQPSGNRKLYAFVFLVFLADYIFLKKRGRVHRVEGQ